MASILFPTYIALHSRKYVSVVMTEGFYMRYNIKTTFIRLGNHLL